MFGPAFMAAPVYEYGAREREVYFPECEGWYDYYTGEFHEGGAYVTVDAPYERMPLYVRAGSIVPVGPEIQWSDEKPADVIDLYVYAGADGSFTLYEDENVNYNYEKGAYARIPMTYNDAESTLTIDEREGEFPGMLQERTFKVVVVNKENPRPFDLKAEGQTVKYDGARIVMKLER